MSIGKRSADDPRDAAPLERHARDRRGPGVADEEVGAVGDGVDGGERARRPAAP